MFTCAKLGWHFSVIFEELESLGIKNRIKLFRLNIFFQDFQKNLLVKWVLNHTKR